KFKHENGSPTNTSGYPSKNSLKDNLLHSNRTMAHFALLWKARTIEKYRRNYENEKINSITMSNSEIPEKTLLQRWRNYSHHVQNRLSRTFSKWYPEGSTMSNFLVNFRAEMKFPHILLRSLFGFVGGLALTYLCSVFLVFQLSLSCLVFLLIPQLFSRAGRYTLTCYALVLILTGPATNTLKNSEVLTESMACTALIQSSFTWLGAVAQSCNDQLGTPYSRCRAFIHSYQTPCAMYTASYVAKVACGMLRPYEKIKNLCQPHVQDPLPENPHPPLLHVRWQHQLAQPGSCRHPDRDTAPS
ncbi:hypothetical protein OBRU01_03658, partial [Operophtera brumata]